MFGGKAMISLAVRVAAGLCLKLIDNPDELQRVGAGVLGCFTQPVRNTAVNCFYLIVEPMLVALWVAVKVRIFLEWVLERRPVYSALRWAVSWRVNGDISFRSENIEIL